MNVEDLKKKYPVTHGRDFGKRTTLEGIVERVGQALDVKGATRQSAHDIAADILDRDLLFGAWGARWQERDRDLLRDIRGAIILAYEAGRNKRSEIQTTEGQSGEGRPSWPPAGPGAPGK